MLFNHLDFFDGKTLTNTGVAGKNVHFVAENQLKSQVRWSQLISPFTTKEDSDNLWRGEFYGKEMRGASLVYRLTQDEELYNVLCNAVKELLSTQEDNGRISTYSEDAQFNGWDLWCRKYVLTGTMHFYRICHDQQFKKEILSKLQRHADYIISKIGNGKIDITQTSAWWGCVNSCTILEPMLDLYRETGEQRYFDFAKYIISTGGSRDCNFLQLALDNQLMPFQYPVVKAYETMSFFEGLLAYYEITGEQMYLQAVKNFADAVAKSDLTLIGCSGCTHELFDNSTLKQTEFAQDIMQETCVTVTWMRLSARLFWATNDVKYIDRIEQSAFNALYGSLNIHHHDIINLLTDKYAKGMTFDSYSPLYMNSRGRGTGGYMEFRYGGSCGCCDAIGACGVALVPLVAAMKCDEGVVVNYPFEGKLVVNDKNGKAVTLLFDSKYPAETTLRLTVVCDSDVDLGLFVRRPTYCDDFVVNGESKSSPNGYVDVGGLYKNGDVITIEYKTQLRAVCLNGKTAFSYGCLVLAADEMDSSRDIEKPVLLGEKLQYTQLPACNNQFVRFEVELADGDKLLLSDYQSVGKHYGKPNNRITVWFN